MKKILVTKEWHSRALGAMADQEKGNKFIQALQVFVLTKLSPEQQKELEAELNEWADIQINGDDQ